MANWQYANVLNIEADKRQVWQFSASGGQFVFQEQLVGTPAQKLPGYVGGKSWGALWRKKLNIAWLPAEKVYLRAIQLPVADFAETVSMVELQLEKISPLPVGQIVWSAEVLPGAPETNLQTVIVTIVPSNLVEQYLGQLEGQGYLADRVELPLLDQLLVTQFHEEGVWIFPGSRPEESCLIAWFYGGILQNVTLLAGLTSAEQGERFKEQLSQIAWSGELEGWMTSPPKWHLVASPENAALWEPILTQLAGEPVQTIPALGFQQLAALTARRAASSRSGSLIPLEFTGRYHQQAIDRLWMRGLGAVIGLYIVGILIYFSALEVVSIQLGRLQSTVTQLNDPYNKVVQLKQKVDKLQQQAALKYAALDSWKFSSDFLPQNVVLNSFTFSRGRSISLFGTVPQDEVNKLSDYNEALQGVQINGKALQVEAPIRHAPHVDKTGQTVIDWSFNCRIPGDEAK